MPAALSTIGILDKDGTAKTMRALDEAGDGSGPFSFANFEKANTLATGQVSVGNTATLIAAARAGRKSITIINAGTTDVYLGASGVATGTGLLLYGQKGAGITIDGGAAVYGIVASGSQTVSYLESY